MTKINNILNVSLSAVEDIQRNTSISTALNVTFSILSCTKKNNTNQN